ncbi:glyoxal reductase-like [Sycon ciliatum]|uniref:glyoxal reductase-like n=1 Tax=Sycon ciliatum TaxID=27933 RepID=UPI0031F60FE0
MLLAGIQVLGLLSCLLIAKSTAAVAFADVPSVPLSNAAVAGLRMPVIGLGTWAYGFPGEKWNDTIGGITAGQFIKLGGRRIDGALGYGDQAGVGKGILASGIERSELFVTSKIPCYGYNETLKNVDEALSTLNMSYVDLLLIHWPYSKSKVFTTDPNCKPDTAASAKTCRQSVWRALEAVFRSGRARAIGVSNFEQNHLQDILDMADALVPAVNQVEFHPYWHEDDLVAFCQKRNITYNSYSPLSCPDWAPKTHFWSKKHGALDEDVVMQAAKAHGKTPAQVVIRWAWQQGVVVNPRTYSTQHMAENLAVFDFELSAAEMAAISSIKPPKLNKVCPDPHKDP